MKTIDLNNPKDAKMFLRGVRIQGREITQIHLADKTVLNIEEMNDEQLTFYAKEIYFDFCGGKEGKGGVVGLVTENQNQ